MSDSSIDESKVIGSRIRAARVKRGMSQAELAVKANISLPHISDLERGKSSMMLASFIRIAEALQVSADSLLRPNVPSVKNIYESELSDLFDEFSTLQMDSIIRIVEELKNLVQEKEEL